MSALHRLKNFSFVAVEFHIARAMADAGLPIRRLLKLAMNTPFCFRFLFVAYF
jgi:hypothetical protein